MRFLSRPGEQKNIEMQRLCTAKTSTVMIVVLSASLNRRSEDQISSSLTVSEPIAISDASRNVAENVPRLILLAIEASVSCSPCFLSRSSSAKPWTRLQRKAHCHDQPTN